VDGDPFSQAAFNGRFWAAFPHPYIRSHLLGPGFDYLNADLTLAYDGTLQSYDREYFLLKPDILIVRDRLRSAQPHEFSWLLHAPNGTQVSGGTASASIRTATAVASLLAVGPSKDWRTVTTPLPISAWENLDKQRIHPGHELVLTSGATNSTQFVVAMHFAAAGASRTTKLEAVDAASATGIRIVGDRSSTVLFRTGSELLQSGSVSADSSVLVVRSTADAGVADWAAVEARIVRQGDRMLFRSAAAADVAVEHRDSGLQATIHTPSDQSLELFYATAPHHLEIDGRATPISYRNGMVVLPALSPGEHRVSIH
jgi:hypothetical protein